MQKIAAILLFLVLSAGLGAGAGLVSYRTALDGLADQGRADLALATDRFTLQLLRYRELAVVLTSHPGLQARLFGAEADAASDELVRAMADKTGAYSVDLVDAEGHVLASSSPWPHRYDPGEELLFRARAGALGTSHRLVLRAGDDYARVFSFAAPVFSPVGPAVGAVIASVDVRGIEDNWPGNAPAAFFVDDHGVVFASNRSELLLTRQGVAGSFPAYDVRHVSGNEVWTLDGGPYLPHRALYLARAVPTIGLTASVLLDAGPAIRGGWLAGAAVMALALVFGAALLMAVQQRWALAERLRVKAAANAHLEARVSERTRALATANADLRREVAERKEAEAALKRAQNELVQAGKLSALGKMSAGISHELNQPLMAIRSFAENGETFFERGTPEKARANLGRIAELARRAGRIIQNLRAFARQESGPVSDVDLVAVVEAALEVTADKLADNAVEIVWERPAGPVLVRGGEVRLQQVVVNLITNAVDAMAAVGAGPARRIEIGFGGEGERVTLSLRDTGPGLSEPGRVFDPFYTTKAVGAAEGMGLGLSISYGLVQSFGGTIQGANHPEGGAVFTVELGTAREAAA